MVLHKCEADPSLRAAEFELHKLCATCFLTVADIKGNVGATRVIESCLVKANDRRLQMPQMRPCRFIRGRQIIVRVAEEQTNLPNLQNANEGFKKTFCGRKA